jgi:hypothetical protein
MATASSTQAATAARPQFFPNPSLPIDSIRGRHRPPDPFEEGKAAAAQGKPASSNPYPPDSDDHEDWAEGHDYASGSDDDDELMDDDEEGEPIDDDEDGEPIDDV